MEATEKHLKNPFFNMPVVLRQLIALCLKNLYSLSDGRSMNVFQEKQVDSRHNTRFCIVVPSTSVRVGNIRALKLPYNIKKRLLQTMAVAALTYAPWQIPSLKVPHS